MKRLTLVLIALLILGTNLLVGPNTAQAAGNFINFYFTGNGTCTNTYYSLPATNSWSVSSSPTLTLVETVNGATIYNNTLTTSFTGTGSTSGLVNNFGSYTQAQPYSFTIELTYKIGGTVIGHAFVSARCNGNVATLTSGGAPGAPLPAGFVLRTITCDTPVYETAGGIPVPSGEHIINGQTWYVNPTAVKDAKGKSWTEIFAGGFINGFIPTSCVGGKPAGYGGA